MARKSARNGANPGVRLVTCPSCDHQLRYGTSTCSYCFQGTPVQNRIWVPPLVLAGAALLWALVL